jgi:plasmid maintenance system antidote protein VapI
MTDRQEQPALSLDALLSRLTSELARLLTSGSTTERKLASQLGISQPHLHNILSGKRKLTSAIADQVFERMSWNLLDLFEARDLALALEKRKKTVRFKTVPCSLPGAGPDVLFPGPLDEEHAVPSSWLIHVTRPAVISLRFDAEMAPLYAGGDLLLVDQDTEARSAIGVSDYYIVRDGGSSLVRQLRDSGRGIYLVSRKHRLEPSLWPHLPCTGAMRTNIIQAKVIACLRPPDNTFQSPARLSGAN